MCERQYLSMSVSPNIKYILVKAALRKIYFLITFRGKGIILGI